MGKDRFGREYKKRREIAAANGKEYPIEYQYYAECIRDHPVQGNLVMYEAQGAMWGTANAVFRAFLRRSDFTRYEHVWVLHEPAEVKRFRELYPEKNVRCILYHEMDQKPYIKCLATAKYLIKNGFYPHYFSKRPEQVYVNACDEIAIREAGYEVYDGNFAVRNAIRNFLQADYITVPNAYMTGVLKNSYKLQGIYEGSVIEMGLLSAESAGAVKREDVISRLGDCGITVSTKKKILIYAPFAKKTEKSLETEQRRITRIERILKAGKAGEDYQLLVIVSQRLYAAFSADKRARYRLVPETCDIYQVLGIADVLVTDYSDFYLNFLSTGKPILFAINGMEEKADGVKEPFAPAALPGPVMEKLDELPGLLENLKKIRRDYQERYEAAGKWCQKFLGEKDADALLSAVVDKKQTGNPVTDFKTDKKKLLIYGSGMAMNGKTEALLPLLDAIDYETYDVTMLCFNASRSDSRGTLRRINKNVRVINKISAETFTKEEQLAVDVMRFYGVSGSYGKKLYEKYRYVYRREAVRMLGNTSYDVVIDFSGYAPNIPLVLLQVPAKKYLIWLHNDLEMDLANTEKTELNENFVTLEGITSVYEYYDGLVSVTSALQGINKRKLSTESTAERFTCATNLLNKERILRLKEEEDTVVCDGEECVIVKSAADEGMFTVLKKELPKGAKRFVNVGRLSPEKNQENLIEAFARFEKEYPGSQLIIMGEGVSREDLQRVIRRHHMERQVILTGNVKNPLRVMRQADCFVFPSIYEGQGLVVLEARMLHMPIIVSHYEAVESVCVPNGQRIIGMEADDIYGAMIEFAEGRITGNYEFDIDAYNRKALEEFYQLL